MAGIPKKRETLDRLHSDEKFINCVKKGAVHFYTSTEWAEDFLLMEKIKNDKTFNDFYYNKRRNILNDILRDMYRFITEFEFIYFESSRAGRMLMLPGRIRLLREDGTLPQFIYNRMKLIIEHEDEDRLPHFFTKQEIFDFIEISASDYEHRCMTDYNINKMIENEDEYKEIGYI